MPPSRDQSDDFLQARRQAKRRAQFQHMRAALHRIIEATTLVDAREIARAGLGVEESRGGYWTAHEEGRQEGLEEAADIARASAAAHRHVSGGSLDPDNDRFREAIAIETQILKQRDERNLYHQQHVEKLANVDRLKEAELIAERGEVDEDLD